MFLDPLDLTAPLGAFNGGLFVNRDMSPIHELAVDEDLVGPIIEAALRESAVGVGLPRNRLVCPRSRGSPRRSRV